MCFSENGAKQNYHMRKPQLFLGWKFLCSFVMIYSCTKLGVIVAPAFYPPLHEFLHFEIKSTVQKLHCAKNSLHLCVLIKQSGSLVCTSSKLPSGRPLKSTTRTLEAAAVHDQRPTHGQAQAAASNTNARFVPQSDRLMPRSQSYGSS